MTESIQKINEINPPVRFEDGPLAYNIQLEGRVEVPGDTFEEWLDPAAEGLGWVVASAALGPAALAGTLFNYSLLASFSLGGYSYESGVWYSISDAMCETSITNAIHESLQRRLQRLPENAIREGIHAEVIVEGCGLMVADSDLSCLMLASALTIDRDGDELLRKKLNISPYDPGEDMPPPQCARLVDFADDDGRLLRDMLYEYSSIIAYEVLKHAQTIE